MKSVYTGGEKVAEFENYNELRVGENKPAFIYEGDELVYPNPVKDGLVLWYDFSGRTNADSQRGIAEDLSGNGNHGTLQNFNYTSESGYDKNKLLFDGVDDQLQIPELSLNEIGMSVGVDGKVYAYEDDKVLTVGEDGSVAVGGRNLLANSNIIEFSPSGWDDSYSGSTVVYKKIENNFTNLKTFDGTNAIKVYRRLYNIIDELVWISFEVNNNTEYELIIGFNNFRELQGSNNILPPNFKGRYSKLVERNGRYPQIQFKAQSVDKNLDFDLKNMIINTGELPAPYSPAPEDYKTTILSPSSMRNLQLYNRPLTPEEIEHNYAVEKERFGIE